MSKTILANIANGAFWTALARISVRLIGLTSTIILARLLSPHDFGLVAIGMVFISTLKLLGSFDFDTVLIQHPKPTRQHYDTAWTLNTLYFAIAAILLVAFAPLIASFYNTPQLTHIIYVLSFGFMLTGSANIKIIDFQKEFRFRYDFTLTVSSKIAGFIATVAGAFIFRDYRALLAGFLANRIIKFILGYWMSPYLARPCLSETRSLFRFSSWLLLKNFFFFLNNKSTEMILGKILGTTPLGIFTVGHDIASMPTNELTSTINRAAYPGYTKIATDKKELRKTIIRIYSLIATIAIPASIGIFLVAAPFTYVILGQKWMASIPVIQIIAIAGLLISLESNLGYVLIAINKPNLSAMLSGLRAAILVPLLIILTPSHGIYGAAFSVLISTIPILLANIFILNRQIQLTLTSLLGSIWRPCLAVCIMAVTLILAPIPHGGILAAIFSSVGDALQTLIYAITLGSLTYIAGLLFIWFISGKPEGIENDAIMWIKRRFA